MDPTTTPIPDKLFYRAAEVCQITDTQPYVLRFWESEFPQLASEKNRSGQRVYRRKDIELVLRIKKLLYQEEYTIAGARKALDEGEATLVEPAPAKGRSRRSAPPAEPQEAPKPAQPAVPSTLFTEHVSETAKVRAPVEAPPAAEAGGNPGYKGPYEETLAELSEARERLARSDGHLNGLRERNRRLAVRIEEALQA